MQISIQKSQISSRQIQISSNDFKSPSDKFKAPSDKVKAPSNKFKAPTVKFKFYPACTKLHLSSSNLYLTSSKLHPTRSKLHQTSSSSICQVQAPYVKFKLHPTSSKLHPTSPKLHPFNTTRISAWRGPIGTITTVSPSGGTWWSCCLGSAIRGRCGGVQGWPKKISTGLQCSPKSCLSPRGGHMGYGFRGLNKDSLILLHSLASISFIVSSISPGRSDTSRGGVTSRIR